MAASSDITVGILTVSDTVSGDPTKDLSGPGIRSVLESAGGYRVVRTTVVPDDALAVQNVVREWCDVDGFNLVVTTGGTGFGVRDITPEAITPLLQKLAPGLTHLMTTASLAKTPFAALSRLVCGVRGKTIIVTTPGSPKGAKENVEALLKVLPHAVDLACGGSGAKVHATMDGSSGHGGHGCVHHARHEHHHHHGGADGALLSGAVAKRQRKSPYPMTSVEEALETVVTHANRLEPITMPVDENLVGAVLAEDITATEAVPAYRTSIVDGYAVIAQDGPNVYPVVAVSTADVSSANEPLKPGQIARITTGGPMPPGADAVVMVEDTKVVRTSPDGMEEEAVEICTQVHKGENVRELGSDVAVGAVVMRKGEVVTAVGGELGVLASVGVRSVCAYRRPILGILSTGNEVVQHDGPDTLLSGQIRDSNRPTLKAIARAAGFEAKDFGIARDSPEELASLMRKALADVDVLVTTGGASLGELDLLKPTLEQSLGATIRFGRLKMKPGKPTTFATLPPQSSSSTSGKLIFALPGNPVSANVTFYLLVLPALRKLAGYERWRLPVVKVEILSTLRLDPRPEYHRAWIAFDHNKERFVAESTGNQRSSRMLSMRGCNALLQLPAESESLKELVNGTIVDALVIGSLA